MQKINLQEPQRNRNANANFVNLIRTSTVEPNVTTVIYTGLFKRIENHPIYLQE